MTGRALSIARSVGIIGATGALIAGATFAAATNTVSITGVTFSADNALEISNLPTTDFSQNTIAGPAFAGLVAGKPSTAFNFALKNTDSTLVKSVNVSIPATPADTLTGTDATHVTLTFGDGTTTQQATLAALEAVGGVDLTTLKVPAVSGGVQDYSVTATVNTTGSLSNAHDTGFNLNFMGNQ